MAGVCSCFVPPVAADYGVSNIVSGEKRNSWPWALIRVSFTSVKKGYYRSQFEDAFHRYVPGYSRSSAAPDPSNPETDAIAATPTEIVTKASSGAGLKVAAGEALKKLVADVDEDEVAA